MAINLNTKAWLGFIFLAAAMGAILFFCAGTFQYWQAWAYLGVFFGASFLITRYLIRNNPALLSRRLSAGPTAEKERTQKIIMFFASGGFISSLVVPALGYRFKWSSMPVHLELAGDVLTAVGFYITFLVNKENPFASATIRIAEHQSVISTGPYAMVRHPMYAGGLLLFMGAPLALGSYWGLLSFLATLPVLIWRLLDEETFLTRNLPGYGELRKGAVAVDPQDFLTRRWRPLFPSSAGGIEMALRQFNPVKNVPLSARLKWILRLTRKPCTSFRVSP